MSETQTIIMIPARMASERFPGKPLAEIAGKTMIEHVIDRALESEVGPVCVACSEQEVYDVVTRAGARAVMTDPDLPSGTDRIHQALLSLGEHYEYIINVQGDLPTLDPVLIQHAQAILASNSKVDISTLAAPIHDESERNNPHVVKPVISTAQDARVGRALYFTRATAPYGDGPIYHHIGLYGYRHDSLERFVSLDPSPLERREKLEQLRALEYGLRIDVAIVDTVPLGVDTPEDLEKAGLILNNNKDKG